MVFDERDFSHQRYLTLLASKPVGANAHGRVWKNRDEAFMVSTEGQILTVTSIARWLTATGLMALGPARARGGDYLVPTRAGLDKLDEKLRGGAA